MLMVCWLPHPWKKQISLPCCSLKFEVLFLFLLFCRLIGITRQLYPQVPGATHCPELVASVSCFSRQPDPTPAFRISSWPEIILGTKRPICNVLLPRSLSPSPSVLYMVEMDLTDIAAVDLFRRQRRPWKLAGNLGVPRCGQVDVQPRLSTNVLAPPDFQLFSAALVIARGSARFGAVISAHRRRR
ncbi:hypothetical protein MAPG_06416 [Magnaporthiopsis poae ATCC 64411]|uniref:Uncharacterized protein n=1 Tax=Magnaporthiopsis poae (strain ATCC 64411 / 73-15) TaxID=644358 RepID=A0A0C4E1Z0_MAGP6|nr:hypothetical protein MAPG_06416 [Magnaporthiopsis poae ATCC 64411]